MIRGNLMVIPVENSFLYVEPVFLLAEGWTFAVAAGDRGVRGRYRHGADPGRVAGRDIGEGAPPAAVAPEEDAPDSEEAVEAAPVVVSADDLERVRVLWNRLREAFESGDWAQYGEVMEELDRAITE